MPQLEDFGITSIEAQSFGIPVIAYNKGGSTDTVIDNVTGILFNEQNEESLDGAIAKFDKIKFNKQYLITNSKKFSFENFKKGLLNNI